MFGAVRSILNKDGLSVEVSLLLSMDSKLMFDPMQSCRRDLFNLIRVIASAAIALLKYAINV